MTSGPLRKDLRRTGFRTSTIRRLRRSPPRPFAFPRGTQGLFLHQFLRKIGTAFREKTTPICVPVAVTRELVLRRVDCDASIAANVWW